MKFLIQNKFFKSILKYQKYVLICFFVILIIGLFEALVLSPQDYLQGDSVRIMYVHVPSAWLALGIFSIISILSVLVFIFKNTKPFMQVVRIHYIYMYPPLKN